MADRLGSRKRKSGDGAAGSAEAVGGKKAAGSVEVAGDDEMEGIVEAAGGDESAGSVEAAGGHEAAGSVESSGSDEAAGRVEPFESDEAAGSVEASESDEAAGSVEAAGGDEAAGSYEPSESDEAAGSYEPSESDESAGGVDAAGGHEAAALQVCLNPERIAEGQLACPECNWSELPEGLLRKIYKFLECRDKVGMSLVCKNWSGEFDGCWEYFNFELTEKMLDMEDYTMMELAESFGPIFEYVRIICPRLKDDSHKAKWAACFANFMKIVKTSMLTEFSLFNMEFFFKAERTATGENQEADCKEKVNDDVKTVDDDEAHTAHEDEKVNDNVETVDGHEADTADEDEKVNDDVETVNEDEKVNDDVETVDNDEADTADEDETVDDVGESEDEVEESPYYYKFLKIITRFLIYQYGIKKLQFLNCQFNYPDSIKILNLAIRNNRGIIMLNLAGFLQYEDLFQDEDEDEQILPKILDLPDLKILLIDHRLILGENADRDEVRDMLAHHQKPLTLKIWLQINKFSRFYKSFTEEDWDILGQRNPQLKSHLCVYTKSTNGIEMMKFLVRRSPITTLSHTVNSDSSKLFIIHLLDVNELAPFLLSFRLDYIPFDSDDFAFTVMPFLERCSRLSTLKLSLEYPGQGLVRVLNELARILPESLVFHLDISRFPDARNYENILGPEFTDELHRKNIKLIADLDEN